MNETTTNVNTNNNTESKMENQVEQKVEQTSGAETKGYQPTPNSAQEQKVLKPVVITIDGQSVVGTPKVFSTGSRGWNSNGKVTLTVGASYLSIQFNGSVVGLTSNWRKFSTGSWGWNLTGKAIVEGQQCQVSGNLVCVKSKEWEEVPDGDSVKAQVAMNIIIIGSKPGV